MNRSILLALLALVLVVWGRTALYTVDHAEYAHVTRFGEPIVVRDGGTDAGLHFKAPWPIDAVRRIDRRLQVVDLPAVESLTRDPVRGSVDKTLSVDTFVTWRIPNADAADKFVRTVGTPEQARRLLAPQINGRLASVVANMSTTGLIGVIETSDAHWAVGGSAVLPHGAIFAVADERAVDARADRLRALLLGEDGPVTDRLRDRTREQYGIEIVDLRIRRFGYPEAVRASIAERIRSERAGKVEEYDSQGLLRAQEIVSQATADAKAIEAEAEAEKTRTVGAAMIRADQIRNQAHAQDREFYTFLKKIELYQKVLSESRDTILLSTRHPLFDRLLTPPANGVPEKPAQSRP